MSELISKEDEETLRELVAELQKVMPDYEESNRLVDGYYPTYTPTTKDLADFAVLSLKKTIIETRMKKLKERILEGTD